MKTPKYVLVIFFGRGFFEEKVFNGLRTTVVLSHVLMHFLMPSGIYALFQLNLISSAKS